MAGLQPIRHIPKPEPCGVEQGLKHIGHIEHAKDGLRAVEITKREEPKILED